VITPLLLALLHPEQHVAGVTLQDELHGSVAFWGASNSAAKKLLILCRGTCTADGSCDFQLECRMSLLAPRPLCCNTLFVFAVIRLLAVLIDVVFCPASLRAAGLGPKSTNCFIISGKDNQGDGITVCDKAREQAAPDGYEVRWLVRLPATPAARCQAALCSQLLRITCIRMHASCISSPRADTLWERTGSLHADAHTAHCRLRCNGVPRAGSW
jgi:hypothetical protein